MNSPLNQDWLEEAARRRISAEEAARWRRELAARPDEVRRLSRELALNDLLDGRPRPAVSTNFTSRVLAEIDQDSRRGSRFALRLGRLLSGLASLRLPIPRLALVATACAALLIGWNRFEVRRHGVLARQAAEISLAAGSPGVAVFGDFEAVRLLSTPVSSDDMDLMEALRTDAE
jgi:hypothetical protein